MTRFRLVQLEISGQVVVGLVPATLTDSEIATAGTVGITFSDEYAVPGAAPIHVVFSRLMAAVRRRVH